MSSAPGTRSIVVIGYGNPGRQDDGLGPALAAALEQEPRCGVTIESGYQLAVEDAALAAEHDVIVFADASVDGGEPFEFRRLEPRADSSFTSHHLTPQALLALAQQVFGRCGEAWLLSIRGYAFGEFEERLSAKAAENLRAAVEFLREELKRVAACG